jgi:hypothetical protein
MEYDDDSASGNLLMEITTLINQRETAVGSPLQALKR